MNFISIKEAAQKQLDKMAPYEWFVVDCDKYELWDTYLDNFPEGTNLIHKENREYDCNCCKQFVRELGRVVTIIDNKLVSMWDIVVEGEENQPFQVVADALSVFVKKHPIKTIYRSDTKKIGTDKNHVYNEDGTIKKWEHFYYELDAKFVVKDGTIGKKSGHAKANYDVLKRSVETISRDAINVVLELIEQNSLYKGEENLHAIKKLSQVKKMIDKEQNESTKELMFWDKSIELGTLSRFRNTSIGTLLVDISEGTELEVAVKKFEDMVAPHNYKRSKSIITSGMIKKAEGTVASLGAADSLPRRFAVPEDISVNNVLYADRSTQSVMQDGGVFDSLKKDLSDKKPNLDKVEEVSIKDFLANIMPKAESLELFMENNHKNKLMSLISPINKDSKNIFKWDNNFSWSYNGEVTDSLKQKVREAGGNVEGALTFSHTWNYDGCNQSLMDLHVFMPKCPSYGIMNGSTEIHDNYPTKEGHRVGWNCRQDKKTGAVQDVDFVQPPNKNVPVENISFPSLNRMPDGDYVFKIHNWKFRQTTTSGFKARIAFGDEVYHYQYNKPVKHKEWITLAVVTLKNGKFTINHKLKPEGGKEDIWNISTQKWQKVSMVMNSPNHWDGNETGNKHWFFILEDCINPDPARGFYNEFLRQEFHEDRKVFEMLASKMKTEESDKQLSGLGFSSTQRNSILCKVSGSFNRVVKINF